MCSIAGLDIHLLEEVLRKITQVHLQLFIFVVGALELGSHRRRLRFQLVHHQRTAGSIPLPASWQSPRDALPSRVSYPPVSVCQNGFEACRTTDDTRFKEHSDLSSMPTCSRRSSSSSTPLPVVKKPAASVTRAFGSLQEAVG